MVIREPHMQIMQHMLAHNAVNRRIEAKKLLNRTIAALEDMEHHSCNSICFPFTIFITTTLYLTNAFKYTRATNYPSHGC